VDRFTWWNNQAYRWRQMGICKICCTFVCVHPLYYCWSSLLLTFHPRECCYNCHKNHLPGEHPLHRLLAPFTYRTITINNNGARSLVPERAILHRTSAYTYQGLLDHFSYASTRLPFYLHSPRNQLSKRQTDTLPGKLYPYGQDSLEFYDCIANYVKEYLAIYWKDID